MFTCFVLLLSMCLLEILNYICRPQYILFDSTVTLDVKLCGNFLSIHVNIKNAGLHHWYNKAHCNIRGGEHYWRKKKHSKLNSIMIVGGSQGQIQVFKYSYKMREIDCPMSVLWNQQNMNVSPNVQNHLKETKWLPGHQKYLLLYSW